MAIPLKYSDTNRKRKTPTATSFLAGALSGTCSTLLLQPFDVVKTRIQEQSTLRSNHSRPRMFTVISGIVASEGASALWAGLVPSLWRCVPGVALYFSSIETLKSLVLQRRDHSSHASLGPVEAFLVGASSRCFATTVLMPFTVVKTRFESGTHKYSSTLQGLRTIYSVEGARGLMSGTVATLARDVPFSALYYAAYSQLQKYTKRKSLLEDFACGAVAGLWATLVTHPADVVKTRLQLFPNDYQHGYLSVIKSVYQSQGPAGFFVGIAPRLLRRTLVAALSWSLFEQVKRYFRL